MMTRINLANPQELLELPGIYPRRRARNGAPTRAIGR